MTDSVDQQPQAYKDDDLVYVDPETRMVIGRVEWMKNDRPKSLPYKPVVSQMPAGKKDEGRRSFSRKFYPWGTYKSMRRIYKIEGKVKDPEPNKTLEEVLPKALNETYWQWDAAKKPESAPSQ